MNTLEKLVGTAIVVILGFIFVNNYVSDFLVKSGWESNVAAVPSLVVSVVIVGIFMGIVSIFINTIIKR